MMTYVCMMKTREGTIDRIETFCSDNDKDAYDRAVMACAESANSPDGGAELWSGGRLVRALTIV